MGTGSSSPATDPGVPPFPRDHGFTTEEIHRAFSFPVGLFGRSKPETGLLAKYSIFPADDPDREAANKAFKTMLSGQNNGLMERGFGCFFGNICGDALGAPFEFRPLQYADKRKCEIKGFENPTLWSESRGKGLKPGQWTDDSSMAFCLADSLLCRGKFDPIDLRLRFLNWWHFGYCNAFGFDADRDTWMSVGLGSIVSASFEDFIRVQSKYATCGGKDSSGNGTVIRCSPIALYYHDQPQKALKVAEKQSRTTHTGDEAAECCRLLVHLIFSGINGDGTVQTAFGNTQQSFKTSLYSVQCLLNSQQEAQHPSNVEIDLADRNWDWKTPNYKYASGRATKNKSYIGSYCMDAMAMAFHAIWNTKSFEEAVLLVANLCGDADSVAAVAGQVAGAIYGLHAIPEEWIEAVLKWDLNDDLPLRAWKLWNKTHIKERHDPPSDPKI